MRYIGSAKGYNKPAGHVVTALIVHHKHPTVVLSFSDGSSVTCTANHPFYVDGEGFTPAGQLAIGSQIVCRAGPDVRLVGRRAGPDAVVYNLTVAGTHTYFVGSDGLWVHNTCPCEFQVGTVSELKDASATGDELDIHHVPQFAHGEEMFPDLYFPNNRLRGDAPAILIRSSTHDKLPTYTVQEFMKDPAGITESMLNDLRNVGTPEESLQKLRQLIFAKLGI